MANPSHERSAAFLVQKKRCDECLFSEGKIVSNGRREEVLRDCQELNTHFVCHKASLKDLDVWASLKLSLGQVRNAMTVLAHTPSLTRFQRGNRGLLRWD